MFLYVTSPPANRGALVKGEFLGGGASMKLCFRFVAKLSTKMQNETQFLINTIVKINIKKFQQFFKIDFSRPLRSTSQATSKTPYTVPGQNFQSAFWGSTREVWVEAVVQCSSTLTSYITEGLKI
jgi:hypothetical protein